MKIICFVVGVVLIVSLIASVLLQICPYYCVGVGFLIPALHKVLFYLTEGAGIAFPDEFVWVMIGLFGGGAAILLFAIMEDMGLLQIIGCVSVSTGIIYVSGIMTQLIPEALLVMLSENVMRAVSWLFIPLFLVVLGFCWVFGLLL